MKTTPVAPPLLPLAQRAPAARPPAATSPAAARAGALRPLGLTATGGGDATPWQPLGEPAGGERRAALRAVKEFEAVFLRQLAAVMTKSASGFAEGSEGAAFYQGLVEEQLGRLLAERGGGMGLERALLARLATGGGDVAGAEGAADAAR